MSTSELVLVRSDNGVSTVTLNRPQARNALSSQLMADFRAAMIAVGEDLAISAVILTGADPAFCAGLDLKELGAGDGSLIGNDRVEGTIERFPWRPMDKPVIGAVNGVAVTGGLELALNCDFLIASDRARFADTHTRVGILPGWGLSVLLPQRVGFAMAKRMSFTGDFVDAPRALEAGLVTEVVPHDQLMPTAHRLAEAAASNNRPAVAALLASYRRIETAGVGEGFEIESDTHKSWNRSGESAGIADRVPGVVSRGRSQVSSPASDA